MHQSLKVSMPILHKNCIITSYLCTGLVLSHLIIPAVFNRHLKDSVIFGSIPAARHTAHAVTMTPAPFSPLKHHVPRNAGKSARSLQFLPALPRTPAAEAAAANAGAPTPPGACGPRAPLCSPRARRSVFGRPQPSAALRAPGTSRQPFHELVNFHS